MNRKQRRAKQATSSGPVAADSVVRIFTDAIRHHQAGRLKDAEQLYRRILAIHPRHADSLHLLGVISSQNGRHDIAVDLITKAIKIDDRVASYHFNLALAYKTLGRLDDAISCWRRSLALEPYDPEIHTNLGIVLQIQERSEEAVTCYRRALTLNPNNPDAYCNLANTLQKLGHIEEAIACWRKAIIIRPDDPEAYTSLGSALTERGLNEEAVACHRQALELKPDFPEACINLGNALMELKRITDANSCYQKAIDIDKNNPRAHINFGNALRQQGRFDEAVDCFRQAVELKPNAPDAHTNLGIALGEQGRLDEAVGCFRQAMELKPDDSDARHSLCHTIYLISRSNPEHARVLALNLMAAYPGDGVLCRSVAGIAGGCYSLVAEALYTQELFDRSAGDFDATLNKLHYSMPEKLAHAALGEGNAQGDLEILDAGCGTGLCGVHLRSCAQRLVGVDLSAKMLEKARARGLYDDLAQSDLVAFMEGNAAAFNLVLAADVLIYIGDLKPLAQAAFLALRPGGICAVSAEILDDAVGKPFILAPSGRYQHTDRYLRETFSAAGFTLEALHKAPTRLEKSCEVLSWVVVCRK